MNYSYRSVADLNADIVRWLCELPRDLELIVGVPRSGLLAGNLLALQLNLPLTDVQGLLEGRVLGGGKRLPPQVRADFLASPRRVLIVDDTVNSGRQLRQVKETVRAAALSHHVRYAAVYVTPEHAAEVDLHCALVPKGRIFEWNLFHSRTLSRCCVDIDGVLCRDPTDEENNDDARYEAFIEQVPPRIVPTERIGWLVTTRLEKYRRPTERWLERHGIAYGELLMLDLPSKEERRRLKPYASFKASAYRKTGAELFIESSHRQALEICRLSQDYVLCIETNSMIEPGAVSARIRKLQRYGRYRLPDLMARVKHRLGRLVGGIGPRPMPTGASVARNRTEE